MKACSVNVAVAVDKPCCVGSYLISMVVILIKPHLQGGMSTCSAQG